MIITTYNLPFLECLEEVLEDTIVAVDTEQWMKQLYFQKPLKNNFFPVLQFMKLMIHSPTGRLCYKLSNFLTVSLHKKHSKWKITTFDVYLWLCSSQQFKKKIAL